MTTDARDAGRFGLTILGNEEARRRKAEMLTFESVMEGLRSHAATAPMIQPAPPSLNLAHKVTGPWNMLGNDEYGCCTDAMCSHHVMQASAYSTGGQVNPTQAQTLQLYYDRNNGGRPFPPGAPQDRGDDELGLLDYLKTHPFMGHTLLDVATLDPKNHEHVRQAVAYMGGVFVAFQVEQACQADFAAHRPWTPGPLLNEGHAVYMNGYVGNTSLQVVTWGALQQARWAWWDECVLGAYAAIPLVQPSWYTGLQPWAEVLGELGVLS